MPLYLQAISLLLPPGKEDASVEDRCEGASAVYPPSISPRPGLMSVASRATHE